MDKKEFETAVQRLHEPFAPRDIDWVPNFAYGDDTYEAKQIAVAPYIRRESVITRLNVVLGARNWKTDIHPLGKLGLYQAILVRCEDEWVGPKWDGAQLTEASSRIDVVKGGVSRSIRRAGEPWGIGLYLQFVPQLFAIKRPKNYYQAEEIWETKLKGGNKLKIRWDHPKLPKEFMPDTMTPEQFVRMSRIIKYFSEDKQKAAKEMLDDWESDPSSVRYEDAEMTIGLVEDRILKRLDAMDNRKVVPPKKRKSNAGNSGTKKDGQNQKSQSSKKQDSSPPENGKDGSITPDKLQEIIKGIKEIKELDDNAIFYEEEWMKEWTKRCNDHHQGKRFISFTEFEEFQEKYNQIMDDLGDDLPF